MDSQMQARFLNHILNFFMMEPKDEGANDDGGVTSTSGPGCPDLPVLLGVLRAAGFVVQYHDKSDFGGSSNGCRAIILCKRSGTRVVLDGEGPCSCPSEDNLNQLLDSAKGRPLSRAPSPTPSTCRMLEDPLNNTFSKDKAVTPDAPPGVTRQKTWSRDDHASIAEEGSDPWSPKNRRLSAPSAPLQSAWATFNGDELNVIAATDLLQEAISLLSGVKKLNIRNTPIGPTRRLSAQSVSRRASSDAFVQPMRPLSRASSSSSGLASCASSRSSSSLPSTHSDTPRPNAARPSREGQAGAVLRRAVSVNAGSVSASTTLPKTPGRTATVTRTKSDASKKGSAGDSSTRPLGSKVPSLLKPPSAIGISRSSTRATPRPGIKTNSSLLMAKPSQTPSSKAEATSPEVESIKL